MNLTMNGKRSGIPFGRCSPTHALPYKHSLARQTVTDTRTVSVTCFPDAIRAPTQCLALRARRRRRRIGVAGPITTFAWLRTLLDHLTQSEPYTLQTLHQSRTQDAFLHYLRFVLYVFDSSASPCFTSCAAVTQRPSQNPTTVCSEFCPDLCSESKLDPGCLSLECVSSFYPHCSLSLNQGSLSITCLHKIAVFLSQRPRSGKPLLPAMNKTQHFPIVENMHSSLKLETKTLFVWTQPPRGFQRDLRG
ncbi:uncharacterized protein LOC114846579 isoform X1 [Betta splendens]|uniref:Uncharacterized protein LOC114846579 isoform X1 n=1 Tax=Betta splendens TaxID=158456 RepID=A0A8M1H759_BETSP|nr:uncharacterized protein LOC114846579 isoform X1 [Betta splendens]